jgi:hypothetical protein
MPFFLYYRNDTQELEPTSFDDMDCIVEEPTTGKCA